jgi:transcriptional regulator with XRE-family HTH domain
MTDYKQLIKLRIRKLGVLLYDARLSAGKDSSECADAMGILPLQYQEYENGLQSPSLPEVESLAYYLNIPLEHFWGSQSLSQPGSSTSPESENSRRKERDRIIGERLTLGLDKSHLTLDKLAARTGLADETIQAYQKGEQCVPLPELETLAEALNISMEELADDSGPIGAWRMERRAVKQFTELPPELQDFISRPVNRSFLELAVRISEMPANQLRTIAESLLEITY